MFNGINGCNSLTAIRAIFGANVVGGERKYAPASTSCTRDYLMACLKQAERCRIRPPVSKIGSLPAGRVYETSKSVPVNGRGETAKIRAQNPRGCFGGLGGLGAWGATK
eukprot:scaffold13078_cov48-Attheya_sp.AAC.9